MTETALVAPVDIAHLYITLYPSYMIYKSEYITLFFMPFIYSTRASLLPIRAAILVILVTF